MYWVELARSVNGERIYVNLAQMCVSESKETGGSVLTERHFGGSRHFSVKESPEEIFTAKPVLAFRRE